MNPSSGDNPLLHVQQGMRVYDADGAEIGVVEEIYLGQSASTNKDSMSGAPHDGEIEGRGGSVVVEGFPDILDVHNLPTELVDRMLRDGYIRIDPAGTLDSLYYVLPDQIASVSEEGVYLGT